MGSSKTSSVTGIKGKRMDFSCTWNENKKNPRDELIMAYRNRLLDGASPKWIPTGTTTASVASRLAMQTTRSMLSPSPSAYKPCLRYLNRTVDSTVMICLSLITTLTAHHTLATLSSYRPRATGNMRVNTCLISSTDPSQGENISPNVAMTETPSLTNKTTPFFSVKHLPKRKANTAGA